MSDNCSISCSRQSVERGHLPDSMSCMSRRILSIVACAASINFFAARVPGFENPDRTAPEQAVPTRDRTNPSQPPSQRSKALTRKIYAHYMGCWPVGTGAIFYQRQTEGNTLKHESRPGTAEYFGGHVRNFDLIDPKRRLSREESAELEMRRAMRIGIDGFAVDAWAGGNDARETLAALFKVAEEKDFPFEITVCIDPTCGGHNVETVREIIARHGNSPKLARRDGRILIFGYQSVWTAHSYVEKKAPGRFNELRASPDGWRLIGESLPDASSQVGEPIYWHFCLSAFFHNVPKTSLPDQALVSAARTIARYADAVGGFAWLGPEQPAIAKAVLDSGAEWAMPVGMYQKENVPYECYVPRGADWMQWAAPALDQNATLLQIITWNDYGENTCIAPAYNTRYTIYDLTAYQIAWWKKGTPPVPERDKLYLIYRKYPAGAKIFPFHPKFSQVEPGVIEVLTILTEPAVVRLPGRSVEYEAPRGFHRRQFPLSAGPVIAEAERNGKTIIRLESPEPITDRPFREDNGFVCWSTEEERCWKEDFGEAQPFWYSEYGDADGDGLPNWFEMYWFSKERNFEPAPDSDTILEGHPLPKYSRWLDFSTAGLADPKADPNKDGKTNLEHYLEQSDPTMPPAPDLPE